jgi:hypothetical protein
MTRAARLDRTRERERAVAHAHRLREQGLLLREIANRLGRSYATVKAYFYDPTGAKGRAVKASYRGRCEKCGRPTSSGDGKGRARRLCGHCARAELRVWDRDKVLAAMAEWERLYGRPPTSTDWSRAMARRRGGEALARLERGRPDGRGRWPAQATVTELFGSFAATHEALADRRSGGN